MTLKRNLMKASSCIALSAVLAFGQIPVVGGLAWADDPANPGTATSTDFNEQDFAKLGLPVSEDKGPDSQAPYSMTSQTNMGIHSEVYTAANGNSGNQYAVRDGLDQLRGVGEHDTKLSNDYGETYGGGGFWSGINGFDDDDLKNEGKYGGGYTSYLSSNSGSNVLSQGGEGFSGLYAKSVEFSHSSDGKASCVAELRAYGDSSRTTIDGTTYKGAIAVELMSISSNGSRTSLATLYPSVTKGQIWDGGFDYLTGDYVQTMESYFDIEAADVDGDGNDEIFVYCGAYEDQGGTRYAIVNMFKAEGSGWSMYKMSLDVGPASNFDTDGITVRKGECHMRNSAVVTFAGGDLDRNGKEEIAITCSATIFHDDITMGSCQVFTWDAASRSLKNIDGLPGTTDGKISLSTSKTQGMVFANCAFGSFKAYGEDGNPNGSVVEGLIIAGYENTYDSSCFYDENHDYDKAGYRFLYYDNELGSYQLSEYRHVSLGKDARLIVKSAWKDADQAQRELCTLAPLALCCANLNGLSGDGTSNDAVLMGGDIYENFQCSVNAPSPGFNNSSSSISLCSEHYNRSNHRDQKGVEQIWIGDVVAGCVSANNSGYTQDGYNAFNESFIAVVGFHRDEDLTKDDDYYWMDLSQYTKKSDGSTRTGQEEVISESNRKNSTYGTWISLCLPDIDTDGVIMTFNNSYKTYTNPQVLAVLQDAPYYQDLENSFGYLVLGGTGFGKGSGSGNSNGFQLDFEVGIAVEFEAAFLAGGRWAAEIGVKGGYEYEHAWNNSCSVSYESHAGEGDKAVIYTVPIVYYVYDLYDESTGSTGQIALPANMGAVTSVVSLDVLDQMCKSKGLRSMGDWLTSSSGNPSSYEVAQEGIDDSFGLGQSGVSRLYTGDTWLSPTSSAGATSTQELEHETENTHTMELGLHISGEMLAGPALMGNKLFFGGQGEVNPGYVRTWVSTKTTTFEGAVDNFPEAASSGYGFQWRLGVNQVLMDDFSNKPVHEVSGDMDDFFIIGYDLKTVESPKAPAVNGLTARGATDSSITLSWDETVSAAGTSFRYGIGMLSNSSTEEDIQIASWRVVDIDKTSLVWDGLVSNKQYRFVMCLIGEDGEQAGIRTPVVTASTLPSGYTFSVQGIDTQVETLPLGSQAVITDKVGGVVALSAKGVITKDGSAAPGAVNYTWYKKERSSEEWEVVARQSSDQADFVSTLALPKLTSDDDGTRYFCMVSYDDFTLDTNVVRLEVTSSDAGSKTVSRYVNRSTLLQFVSDKARSFVAIPGAGVSVFLANGSTPGSGDQGANGNGGSNGGGSSSSAKTGDVLGWALPVILVVLLVAAAGVGAGFVLRKRSNAPSGRHTKRP